MEEDGEMVNHKDFVETGLTPILASYGLVGTAGKIIHCKPYTGTDNGNGSKNSPVKTLVHALALATADKNDIVLLYEESNTAAYTTDYQSTALDWNKDGVHLIGVSNAPFIGHRARIGQTSTVKTITDLFTVSADNCLIAGLEIYQGVASSTASYERAMVVSGMRNKIANCQISGIGDTSMDDAGSCSLAVSGAENYFKDCYIGLDTVLRAGSGALTEIDIVSGGTRNVFDKCIVNSYTSLTTWKAISVAAGSYHTATWLRDCMLCSETNRTSTVTVTGAIIHSGAGNVFMLGGGVFGYAAVSTLDNSSIIALTYYGAVGSSGANKVGIAAGIDTP
jgi:hypothetical protein